MRTRWNIGALTGAAMLLSGVVGWNAPAMAGSDSSSDTYAGDYSGGSLPVGTLIALQYAGWAHANSFIDTNGNNVAGAHASIWEEFTRIAYFSEIGGHKLVWEFELPFATVNQQNLPGTNSQVGSGFADPVFHVTYFFIADAQIQRWIGFTNYFYLPFGHYDSAAAINVSTPHQFTDVPQIGWSEGLAKFGLPQGLFADFVGNVSLHSNGRDPINFALAPPAAPAVGHLVYTGLTQDTSENVRFYLRYQPAQALWFAVGIEKSWGGLQTATNGNFFVTGAPLVIPQANVQILSDDYLRGHFQAHFPLAQTWAIAFDVFHDFERVGNFREEIGAEVRLSWFFFPAPPAVTTKY